MNVLAGSRKDFVFNLLLVPVACSVWSVVSVVETSPAWVVVDVPVNTYGSWDFTKFLKSTRLVGVNVINP